MVLWRWNQNWKWWELFVLFPVCQVFIAFDGISNFWLDTLKMLNFWFRLKIEFLNCRIYLFTFHLLIFFIHPKYDIVDFLENKSSLLFLTKFDQEQISSSILQNFTLFSTAIQNWNKSYSNFFRANKKYSVS